MIHLEIFGLRYYSIFYPFGRVYVTVNVSVCVTVCLGCDVTYCG